ncbi:MAG: hypothetical protein Crog4KO_34670 [Crocinitomicaceae bacterium]
MKMSSHILAIPTYGSHRVKDPQSKKRISAQKIGYSSASADILLALYDEQARDVSSKRQSYRYIAIDGQVAVHKGYILLRLSDKDLAMAETMSKLHHHAGAYLYREGGWQELPNQTRPTYHATGGYSGPQFDPRGYQATLIGEASAEDKADINVERIQKITTEPPWYWISGNTFPHRELLKGAGARWSKKRRSWYLIAEKLPSSIQALVDEQKQADDNTVNLENSDDNAPCSDAEAEKILGVSLVSKTSTPSDRDKSDCSVCKNNMGWIVAPNLDDWVACASCNPEAKDKPDNRPSGKAFEPDPIKIIEYQASDDENDRIQSAIKASRGQALKSVPKSNHVKQLTIPQAICGELTGSITGQVWCYGFGLYDDTCIYVNMAGPRMAVEAIRAKLGQGDIVNLIPEDAPAMELTAGEGNTGKYKDYFQNIPEAKFCSLILLHEWFHHANYRGNSQTFIFHLSDEQAMGHVHYHVKQLLSIPVFEHWTGYLWQAGHHAKLIRKTRSNADSNLLLIDLDADAWARLITGGLSEKILSLEPSTK